MNRAVVSSSHVDGHPAAVLENPHLRATILPTLGGRVWSLEDRLRGRQWIWHREGVPLVAHPAGALYDDVWAGGWEELFPNDAAGTFEGRQLPDHGEWWTLAFHAEPAVSDVAATLRLTATTGVIRAACVKEFTLAHDAPVLTVTYRIRSLEDRPFHFLFKQHLAVAITPSCRLVLPGGDVEAVDPAFGTLMPGPGSHAWPVAPGPDGTSADLRVIPPAESRDREFVYIRDLAGGWCGVVDLDREASLRMAFDQREMPFVWLFLSYGGWRDTYTAVLEPCTNLPKDLGEAVRRRQSARLSPGQEFVTTVKVQLAGLEAEG